jgi:hypothetical protein
MTQTLPKIEGVIERVEGDTTQNYESRALHTLNHHPRVKCSMAGISPRHMRAGCRFISAVKVWLERHCSPC